MGRPPSNGAPAFRFNATEVAQMEAILREHQGQMPSRELLVAIAEKFSNLPERTGKITVQMKQVWNWFQNRRYALRSKLVKSPGKLSVSPMPREQVTPVRIVPHGPQQIPAPSGHNVVSTSETPPMEFEAKSARDDAWYDVQAFLSHRYLETGNPEAQVHFAGLRSEEDEWVNIRKHVRYRSFPCEASECVAVLPGDLILCFQEGKEQALYFDAHVLDAQRRRHDARGCRCRFLVRYDHDQSEEIVPLRKVCRRPETDYRLQLLNAMNETASAAGSVDTKFPVANPSSSNLLRMTAPNPNTTALPAPLLSHMGSATTDPVPGPVRSPVFVPVPVSVSGLDPVSVSVPDQVPVSVSVLAPVSVSVPHPVPITIHDSVPVSVSGSIQVPVSAPDPKPGAVPEQKVESNNSGPLAGGEASVINVINPGFGNVASVPPDTNKSVSSNSENVLFTGNISSAEPDSRPENIETGNPELPDSASSDSSPAAVLASTGSGSSPAALLRTTSSSSSPTAMITMAGSSLVPMSTKIIEDDTCP